MVQDCDSCDTTTNESDRTLTENINEVTLVAISHDGKKIVSGADDKTEIITDTTTREIYRKLQGHTSTVTLVVISSDLKNIVSGGGGKTVIFLNTRF